MKRILDFATSSQLTLQLAYYPPYHSKYNPVERCFGWLEKHWNGSLLETVENVVNFAKTLTFKDKNPVVTLVETIYSTGVTLNKLAMAEIETQINRLPNLQKWFVEIFALTHIIIGSFFLWRPLMFEENFLKTVKPKTLLLLNRGFYHFAFWEQLIDQEIGFITRIKKGASYQVERVLTNTYDVKDQIIKIGAGTKQTPALTIRLVQIICDKLRKSANCQGGTPEKVK